MKIEILQEKENKAMARKEIHFRIDHVGATTPSRADIRAKIVAQFDAESSTVVVNALRTKFGTGITEGSARIYANPEQMKRAELGYILERHEEKKKGEEGS